MSPFESEVITVALERLRSALAGSPWDGQVYLVGGILRDRELGRPLPADIDLVVTGDALAVAMHLYGRGLSSHYPVTYPRFGTAMLTLPVAGSTVGIELVTARAESYESASRKPYVTPATLMDDVLRRDFTVNTLLENLQSGEVLDMTGRARADMAARIIDTPCEPVVTFHDDPLRMLRAVRFAAALDFSISERALSAIRAERLRLAPPAIAWERIRDEFAKIMLLPGARLREGLELLRDAELLERILPELIPMDGCVQNSWHRFDVWVHTLEALHALPDDAGLATRLGLLLHDVGKPATRTEDERGVHFYGHQDVGARIAAGIMRRLKFSTDECSHVEDLVRLHMRLGEYRAEWLDSSVRRLIRACGPYMDELFVIARCDISAANISLEDQVDLQDLRRRIDAILEQMNVVAVGSPLDGNAIVGLLGIRPGPTVAEAKEYLTNEVLDGRLTPGDADGAERLLAAWWQERQRT